MPEIRLPNSWRPRPYQLPLWTWLERGGRRAIAVWHRRAGKDDLALHWTACAAVQEPGNYWHMLPEAAQARKAIWDAVNPHTGRRRIDEAFPPAIRAGRANDHEMRIRLRAQGGESTWQVVGSDNFDSLVGASPRGIVFSEWALADPQAWGYLRPILAENGGWALFISTPRGRNHLATFYEQHRRDSGWFVERLPASATGVFSPEQLAQELREYQAEYGADDGLARYRQEYECDWNVPVVGSYYGRQMADAEAAGRITRVPWDPALPVFTAWDIGVSDSTAIWFFQRAGLEIRVIDYYEASGVGVDHYAKVLRERPYAYAMALWPHDGGHRQMATGDTLDGTFRSLGFAVTVLPREGVEHGIQAVRNLLPRCWFDADRCARGIECLRSYQRAWNEKLRTFSMEPLHNWASHGADAFRTLAKGLPLLPASAGAMQPIAYPPAGVV